MFAFALTRIRAHEMEKVVPNRAANVPRQALLRSERVEQAAHAAAAAPLGRVELERVRGQLHCSLRERLTMIAAVAPQILRPFHNIS